MSAVPSVPPVVAAITTPPPVAEPPKREVVQPEDYPKLQKRWEATQLLMRTDTSPERREEATRYIMAENGYSSEQIESYVQTKRQPAPRDDGPEGGNADDGPDPVVREVVSQGEDLRKMKADRIREKVETHLERALDLRGEAGVLLGELQKKGLPEDRLAKSKENLRKWILREALDALTMRKARSAGKELDLGWIPEELAAASKRVVDEYRAGIPETAAIGISGETDSGEEEFLKTKPVPKPKFEKGMDVGGAQSSLRSWIADTLSRDAMKADDDGGTRV